MYVPVIYGDGSLYMITAQFVRQWVGYLAFF